MVGENIDKLISRNTGKKELEREEKAETNIKEYLFRRGEKHCKIEDAIDNYFKKNYGVFLNVRLTSAEKKFISFHKFVEKETERINNKFHTLTDKAEDFEKKNKKIEAQKHYEMADEEWRKVEKLQEGLRKLAKECKFEGEAFPCDFDPVTIAQQSEEAMKCIPSQHIKKIVKNKALVRVEQKLDYGNKRGFYIPYANGGVIRIFGSGREEELLDGRKLEKVPDWKFTLVHEFGHSLAECLHSSRDKVDKNLYLEFWDLFKKEKENKQRFFREHDTKDKRDPLGIQFHPDEAFADSYALFILDPAKSEEINPDLHGYMKEKIFH